MNTFMDGWVLVTVTLTTVVVTHVAVLCARRRATRIKLVVLGAVYYAYSGIGLATMPDGMRYYLPFTAFLMALCAGLVIAAGRRPGPEGVTPERALPVPAPGQWWDSRLATALAAAYVIATLGQLVAAGTLGDLLHPAQVFLDASQGSEIFTGRLARRANVAYTVLAYLKLLCLPFFFVEMQRRYDRRWGAQLVALLAVTYLQVTADHQWGRAALIKPFLVWLFVLLLRRRISGRQFATLGIVTGLVLVPAFNAISDWRSGAASSTTGLSGSLSVFQGQEFVYPHNFPIAESMSEGGQYAGKFLLWLFTLPIPRGLTGASFSITRDFSEHILGLPYGSPGFYVLLPSWLGEGLIAFGASYCWVWGLLVGIAIGLIDRFLARTTALVTYDAYVTASLAVFLRGSSQEFLGQFANSLWLLLGLLLVQHLATRRVVPGAVDRSRADAHGATRRVAVRTAP